MIKGITIDPSHALDLDDAIWVDSLPGGGWRAQVSIANVARAVRPGSPEDLDARARVATRYHALMFWARVRDWHAQYRRNCQ
jgi:exoribonuclease R